MQLKVTEAARPPEATADSPPRPLSEIVAAALAVGCSIPSCPAQPGTPCDGDGAVHLARLSLACRTGHVTGREFVAVILTVPGIFRPATLIPAVTR
jgi:hypothetical protein